MPQVYKMSDIKIIFLHGFWRSSSTYFWNKFRCLDKTIAFYEPFHEILDSTLKEIPSYSSINWQSNHPYVEDYWKEYKILGIDPSELFTQKNGNFVTEDYYYLTKEKEDYIKKLIDLLINKKYEKIIFGCVRSVAIIKSLKEFINKKYPLINQFHIFFDRSPLNQFESFVNNNLYHKNKYFLSINVLPILFTFPKLAKSIDFDLDIDNTISFEQTFDKVSEYSELLLTPYLSLYKAFLMNKYISLALAQKAFDHKFKLESLSEKENLNLAEKYFSKILNEKIDFSDFKTPKCYFFFKKKIIRILSEEVRDILLNSGKINYLQNKCFSEDEDIDLGGNQEEKNIELPNEIYLANVKERLKIIEKEKQNKTNIKQSVNFKKKVIDKFINLSIKKIIDKFLNIFNKF